jgi:hypothetical protein
MTLATTPLLQPSHGKSRIEIATELINQGLRQLWAEQREVEQRRREFKVTPFDERENTLIRKAEAREIVRQHQVHVNRDWFLEFAHDGLDGMRAQEAEARKSGQLAFANQLERRIGGLVDELERIRERSAPK